MAVNQRVNCMQRKVLLDRPATFPTLLEQKQEYLLFSLSFALEDLAAREQGLHIQAHIHTQHTHSKQRQL